MMVMPILHILFNVQVHILLKFHILLKIHVVFNFASVFRAFFWVDKSETV